MKNTALAKLTLLWLTLFGFATVQAETIIVPRDFPSIQATVNAAPTGATVKVLEGTYVKEVVIAKDLTLEGAGENKTIIQAPATLTTFAQQMGRPVVAIVRITDGAQVNISDLTVSDPFRCS